MPGGLFRYRRDSAWLLNFNKLVLWNKAICQSNTDLIKACIYKRWKWRHQNKSYVLNAPLLSLIHVPHRDWRIRLNGTLWPEAVQHWVLCVAFSEEQYFVAWRPSPKRLQCCYFIDYIWSCVCARKGIYGCFSERCRKCCDNFILSEHFWMCQLINVGLSVACVLYLALCWLVKEKLHVSSVALCIWLDRLIIAHLKVKQIALWFFFFVFCFFQILSHSI